MTPGRRFTALSMRPMQAPQAMPSTARSMPSVPSPAGLAKRERSRVRHRSIQFSSTPCSPQRHAAARAEQPLVAAIKIDDQIPLPRLRRGLPVKGAGAERSGSQSRDRAVRRPDAPAAHPRSDRRAARPWRRARVTSSTASPAPLRVSLPLDLPMQRVLAFGHRDLMLELQAGLVGARASRRRRRSKSRRAPAPR